MQTFQQDATIKLEARPAPGYKFTGWSGGISGSQNPISFSLSLSVTVTASFAPATYTVAVGTAGAGSTTPEAGRYTYNEGDVVNLTATAASGWKFDGWTGDVADPASATTTMSVNNNEQVTAQFSRVTHSVTIAVAGNGHTTPEIGEHTYSEGDVVSLTASPDKGWKFDSWVGDVANPASETTTVTANTNKQITAQFSPVMHTLTVNSSHGGQTPTTVATYQYAEGTTVEVTAPEEKGWRFDSWTGDVLDRASVGTKVVMDSDKTVTANFVRSGLPLGVIIIIVGAVAAALIAFYATRPKRSKAGNKDSTTGTAS
jgi:hypothetical protein